jgi:hypothetical protein
MIPRSEHYLDPRLEIVCLLGGLLCPIVATKGERSANVVRDAPKAGCPKEGAKDARLALRSLCLADTDTASERKRYRRVSQ